MMTTKTIIVLCFLVLFSCNEHEKKENFVINNYQDGWSVYVNYSTNIFNIDFNSSDLPYSGKDGAFSIMYPDNWSFDGNNFFLG
jgi:hypothetical protein